MYALQSNIEIKDKNLEDKFTAHLHIHDRYYDTAVKNKYYSPYTIKGEEINLSNDLSLGFGSDYNYNKSEFKVNGSWDSAKGHADNLGLYSNLVKMNEKTILSGHLRGDSHKYSAENLTYRINLKKFK